MKDAKDVPMKPSRKWIKYTCSRVNFVFVNSNKSSLSSSTRKTKFYSGVPLKKSL